MKLKPIHAGAVLAVLLAGGGFALAQSKPPGPADYPAFSRFIANRNIFDPERQPHASGNYVRPAARRNPRAPEPAFSFVGAIIYGKGMFAFFDGNNGDYRKALQAGGKIAGYAVRKITLGGVALEADGKTVFLPVGSQLRQGKDGAWQLAGESEGFSGQGESSVSATAAGSAPSTAVPAGSSGETSDVLKRLMKLREQENK